MLQAMMRWLMPREDHFYEFLERQVVVVSEAARVMAEYKSGATPATIRERMQDLEHRGDAIVHEMLDALARTFVTPIDREDLQKLSKRLDDILDLTNLAARACVLFGVEKPTPPMVLLIDTLVECTTVLANVVPMLRRRAYAELLREVSAVAKLEKAGDEVFRNALIALFHDPAIDAKVILREKEVLEDLEKAVNRCERVADLLTSLAVKNG